MTGHKQPSRPQNAKQDNSFSAAQNRRSFPQNAAQNPLHRGQRPMFQQPGGQHYRQPNSTPPFGAAPNSGMPNRTAPTPPAAPQPNPNLYRPSPPPPGNGAPPARPPYTASPPPQGRPRRRGLFFMLQGYSKPQLVILTVCALVFLVSAFTLGNYVLQAAKQQQALKEAAQLYSQAGRESAEENPAGEGSQSQEPVPKNAGNAPAMDSAAAESVAPLPDPMPTAALAKAASGAPEENAAPALPTEPPPRSFERDYPDNKPGRVREKFHDLLDINEDIVGWIKIGSFLNQPVVKKDNVFYLNHNYKKEENPAGAIFMDEEADLRTRPENLVLHGHNMRDGSMFGKLIHYKSDAGTKFFLENSFVRFDSLYQDSQYVIFSVFEIETDYDSPNYFPFVAYQRFHSDQDARNFISEVKGRSIIKVPIDVNEKDSLMTLATCTLNSETTRLLVVARRLRAEENMSDLNNALYQSVKIR